MQHDLAQRVDQIRAKATRLTWGYGLARFAAAAIGIAMALGAVDFLLRLHDPTSRWLFSAIAVAVTVLAFTKLAWPAFQFHQGLVATARRIEQRFPKLGERLSSAIAFLAQAETDRTAGSGELRRAVIAEAEALAADVDFRLVLNRRPLLGASALLGAVAVLGLVIGLMNPFAASLAIRRLAMPWRNLAWPRQHELAFLEPPGRLAKGDDLELTLIDGRGSLPDDTEILIRRQTPNGWRTEIRPMKPLGERVVFRLDNLTQPLEYRARGGDDNTMPWIELAVVEPPKIVDLQILVEPPAYSGLPKRSEGQLIKALIGSRLSLRGELDKPIRSARFKSQSPDFAPPLLEVSADGKRITARAGGEAWLIERSGVLTIELTDPQGTPFGHDTRIELQAVEDTPPSIVWETPVDHALVTARAIVTAKGSVKDDIAVRAAALRYLRPGTSDEEQVIEVFASSSPTPAPGQADQHDFQFNWDLSQLTGLTPGDVLAVRITAEDYKSQFTTTNVRRLTIIAPEELDARLAARQSAILSQLGDSLRLAQQCREQTQSLENTVAASGRFSDPDLNVLQAAQYNHQQVQQLLAASREGAEGQIAALLEELAANRSENEASKQRLNELHAQVHRLNHGPLPIIDQELAEASNTARAATENAPAAALDRASGNDLAARLNKAGQHEQEVIDSLEKLIGVLSEWDTFSRIVREIGQIRSDQQRLAGETDELTVKTAAAAGAVPTADRAAARQLSQTQLSLGRRLDKLQARMEGMLAKLTESDPPTAALLADAIDAARRLAIGGQMREIGMRLSQFQLSHARQGQQRALDDLEQLLNALSTRRDAELARRVSALRQASAELRTLSQRGARAESDLAGIARELSPDHRAQLERLRRELEQLTQAGQQLGRRLERLQAPRAAAPAQRAAASSASAARSAAAGQPNEAGQQARDARQQLDEAQAALAKAIADLEQRLAHEQAASAAQAIVGIAARQKNVLLEIERLQGQLDQRGQLPAAQQGALKNLASEQRLLAGETDEVRPQLSAAAFRFALETAASQMRRATSLLERGKTAAATQDAARAALSRLEQILELLRADQPMTPDPSDSADGQPMPSSGGSARTTAELKLLKLLQEEINRRTTEIESIRTSKGKLSDDEQLELESLAGEQGRLADMILGLIETKNLRSSDEDALQPPNRPRQEPKQGIGPQTLNMPARVTSQSLFGFQPPSKAGPSTPSNRTLDQQLLDDLDRELLKGLPSGSKPAQPKAPPPSPDESSDSAPNQTDSQNPLVKIADQMRSVQRRMASRDTSAKTQEQQSEILSRLQSLLDQAGASKGGQPKPNGGGTPQPGAGTGDPIAGPPRDSTNRIERGTKEQVETADVKDAIRRMWGHLPPKLRDEMQASMSEKFLPKYERLIEEYYKRLAEERPGTP